MIPYQEDSHQIEMTWHIWRNVFKYTRLVYAFTFSGPQQPTMLYKQAPGTLNLKTNRLQL